MVNIKRTDTDNVDFKNLVMELDQNLEILYNRVNYEYNSYAKIEYLDTVVVSYIGGIAVGCSCFKEIDKDTVEIKRTFVNPYLRGLGIAGNTITELMNYAKELSYSKAVLEVGVKQVEAIKMYGKSGFQKIENFGDYVNSELSYCMGKSLV